MKQRKKWPPLSEEEELAICQACDGFCCKSYFFNASENPDAMDLHKFRQRKIIRYGTQHALVLKDQCPWVDNENHLCGKYEQRPRLCKAFPESYRPFWNLKCKLMRERYKRGLIPKDVAAFKKVYDKKKSPFKFYKEK